MLCRNSFFQKIEYYVDQFFLRIVITIKGAFADSYVFCDFIGLLAKPAERNKHIVFSRIFSIMSGNYFEFVPKPSNVGTPFLDFWDKFFRILFIEFDLKLSAQYFDFLGIYR